jgi:hypothetical protein
MSHIVEVYNEGMRTEMVPDIYLSPGFYMGFWEASIEALFTPQQIKDHVKLQQHRELRVGAIVAAGITRQSRVHHFIGIPESDPPDILIMWHEEVTVKDKKGTEPRYIHLEVVRCDFDSGETLIDQALIKNKHNYQKMTVAIDVTGTRRPDDYKIAAETLNALETVYPVQFIAVEQVGVIGELNYLPGVFRITQLYPSQSTARVWRADEEAFFRAPTDVIGKGTPSRGISTEWQELGKFVLLPPTL